MAVLDVHAVEVAFAATKPVLENVTLRLVPGWYGLVGANGAGKTTLLRVLSGDLVPDGGMVRCEPRDVVVVVCPQEAHEREGDIDRFARAVDGVSEALRGRLGLSSADVERWSTLSPGERKRWQIGAALAASPDVLLLDEPTNHLDADGRRLLVAALRRFRGIGVVVSHDRALLEELPEVTIRVHDARVFVYAGAYREAKAAWEGARAAREEAHARAKERAGVAAARLVEARQEHASADRARSTRTRMKDKNDHDARGTLAKGRAIAAEARAGRTVGIRRAELARAEAEIPTIERDRTLGASVFASFERAPSPRLFHLDADEVHACATEGGGESRPHVVLRDVRMTIGRDERVRIVGPNGAGKTTLLGALLEGGPPRERLLHLPQELGPEAIEGYVEQVRGLTPEARGRVLSVFAALGSDPERLLRRRADDAALLSPGEARKLALAFGLGRHVWALVLDEPTNHLDLPSIERLERALEHYPGAILLVTHDDAFASACTTRMITVERGLVR
ncbi:MAG: ABC-F family ATP-binding cassette domain-containing protein [Deltaproteobacteria bacterium]|nr:ABC-F family ATP-binding cassette domain-containing protein [Deltaproteobacteria bacterium]